MQNLKDIYYFSNLDPIPNPDLLFLSASPLSLSHSHMHQHSRFTPNPTRALLRDSLLCHPGMPPNPRMEGESRFLRLHCSSTGLFSSFSLRLIGANSSLAPSFPLSIFLIRFLFPSLHSPSFFLSTSFCSSARDRPFVRPPRAAIISLVAARIMK